MHTAVFFRNGDILESLRLGSPKPGHIERISGAKLEDKTEDTVITQRFLKINVRHITDGQGVVSGVLLVTPNAVMFDPNVSDALVIEHGAESYGVIAPMELVVNAAIFYDIAHMRVSGGIDSNQNETAEIYYPKSVLEAIRGEEQTDEESKPADDENIQIKETKDDSILLDSTHGDHESFGLDISHSSSQIIEAPKEAKEYMKTDVDKNENSSSTNTTAGDQTNTEIDKGTTPITDVRPKLTEGRKSLLDHHWAVPRKSRFVAVYRLNKQAFQYVLLQIADQLQGSSIPPTLQLAAALRFLATGSFQAVIGRDIEVSLARTTVSKVLWNVINAMESILCPKWIKLDMTQEEVTESKQFFFENFGIPGVVGCIDGTHIPILKPTREFPMFLNRKGYFSVNVMIICDHKMRIKSIDACRPGSSHDSFIWQMSIARSFLLEKYSNGDRNSWLLADSGYPLEPYLLTPFRNPIAGSVQHKFNIKHTSARNVVERTIGNLKSRFRVLQSKLHYSPEKVVQIVHVSAALHNICKYFNANISDDLPIIDEESDIENDFVDHEINVSSGRDRQLSIRQQIANTFR